LSQKDFDEWPRFGAPNGKMGMVAVTFEDFTRIMLEYRIIGKGHTEDEELGLVNRHLKQENKRPD